jgi:D-lactate dehydrogenase
MRAKEVINGHTICSERMESFRRSVENCLPKSSILSRYSQRVAYATDASFYHLIPELVVMLDNVEQVIKVIKVAEKYKVGITFRAAGTSLSGQAVTDSVLVVISRKLNRMEVTDNGERIKLEPSVIGSRANRELAKYNRKIGPDPASIDSCMIGGIAANNASGMCCGVANNSYHTLADMNIVFADGFRLDTAKPDSVKRFLLEKNDLVKQVIALAEHVKANTGLSSKIKHKYRIKNTSGYGINALLDFSDPVDVIKHLMIGSEGTLGFIADITYKTLPLYHNKMTSFVLLPSPELACQLVESLNQVDIAAVELLDSGSLKSVNTEVVLSDVVNRIMDDSIGLLIEIQADDLAELESRLISANNSISGYADSLLGHIPFTDDVKKIEALWRIRKGIFPSIGAKRPRGTTVIIEDIAVSLDRLSETIRELRRLFEQFGYSDAVIFGHAKDGNLHFVFSQSFDTPEEVTRYQNLINEVTVLVVDKMKGSLKAEHGTGRNMAPFVEKEWGRDAYLVMQKIKHIMDPLNILNPGVIINSDPVVHLKHLKSMSPVDEVIDQCIECGFCESVCPSSELSYSPRQRISVARKMEQLRERTSLVSPMINKKERNDNKHAQRLLKQLEKDYQYAGIDTCAATAMCQTQCPVGINTGDYIKKRRHENLSHSLIKRFKSGVTANYYGLYRKLIRVYLKIANGLRRLFGLAATIRIFNLANRLSANHIPIYFDALPNSETTRAKWNIREQSSLNNQTKSVVYFPACSGRLFATNPKATDQRSLIETTISVLQKAGYRVIIPENLEQFCCGLPWDSNGDRKQASNKNRQLNDELNQLTNNGKIPLITDASPCALFNNERSELKIYESIDFIAQYCLENLDIKQTKQPVLLHITCSSKRAHIDRSLVKVAELCTSNLTIPSDISCCGFAGDKGFLMPELNRHALAGLSTQIPSGCSLGVSNSRTCEIGLARNTGINYQSLMYLLDRVSRAKPHD